MLIDMHCHTLPLSQCSSLKPDEYVDLARQRGVDGICLTEHDAFWGADDLLTLGRRTGFLVLPGIELTTDAGHVLAYGLLPHLAPSASMTALVATARRCGGLVFLAHPARDGLLRMTSREKGWFDSIEEVNGSDTPLQNSAAAALTQGMRLPGIGGSDAHVPSEVARAATFFSTEVTDESSLLAALRAGTYEAVAIP